MYAITASSYRTISAATDLQSGETAVDQLPASLLVALAAAQQRAQRNALLRACDWTQCGDAPLTATARTSWVAYRQALRDVPQQAGFPASIVWPALPAT